ncbi:MAG: coproporphyrinogen oxidase [Haloplasmataceae bacterium]|jgi:oxygen-independent coproporphyrinogen-3 oxidase|nr:coproporphyrinogen oxidase [Haloplasmataceae bacterium]
MANVYIHIPFCQRICHYCDFPKRVSKTEQIDEYLLALEKEIKMYQLREKLDTLYLGGGTPSILNEKQLHMLKRITSQFSFNNNYEFTIECNPEHITTEKVNFYKEMGVNRISLGVQTFNDRLLKLLNRGHKKTDVINAINIIKTSGINNVSIDLIYAIPMQTMENLKEDLEIIKTLDLTHISAYSLILEEKTVFEKMINDKKMTLVDNEIEAEMFQFIMKNLKEIGFKHYEISNYAKNNYESKHNKIYWQNQTYYGFGMGASGYLGNIRYYNENHVQSYINKIDQNQCPIMNQDQLTLDDQIKEEMLLGFRLMDGIKIEEINNKYNINVLDYFKDQITQLLKKGWITIDQSIKLSETGLFFGNEVFELFI